MQILGMKKGETPVTVRVEPPGYSAHEFVLPKSHLRSPHFATLKPYAWKEYGVSGTVYVIRCKLDDFLDAMVMTDTRAPFEPRHPPVRAEAAPGDDEPSSSPRRRTLGRFLARPH